MIVFFINKDTFMGFTPMTTKVFCISQAKRKMHLAERVNPNPLIFC